MKSIRSITHTDIIISVRWLWIVSIPMIIVIPLTQKFKLSRKKANMPHQLTLNTDIAVRNRNYHTATGNHMPYGITQCYLPGRGDFPAFTPVEAGT